MRKKVMKKKVYKAKRTKNLFEHEFSNGMLTQLENPLEAISKVIDFEIFRETLESKLLNTNKKSNAGAKPYDVVMMFKIIILQRYYGLGDRQIEYQIIDRTSFKNFLEIESVDSVPDEKTVWAFRNQLIKTGLVEILFKQFNNYLDSKRMILNKGQMIDASFVTAPRQRNTHEENEKIKNDKGSELWNDNPHKKCHKDIDARWTKKNDETIYGFKNHTKVDVKSKFIKSYAVTSSSVHDSKALEELLDDSDKGQELYADSAYTGDEPKKIIEKYEMINQVNERGYRNNPLTEKQKRSNRKKSKTRARVEHVFGFMEQSMHGLVVKTIGLARATGIIGLINLTYNFCRYEQIQRCA